LAAARDFSPHSTSIPTIPAALHVPTSFGPNAQLHDYTGRHPEHLDGSRGNEPSRFPQMHMAAARLLVAFACRERQTHCSTSPPDNSGILGAPDLDIAPAHPGALISIAKIFVERETTVVFSTRNTIQVALSTDTSPVPITNRKRPAGTGWGKLVEPVRGFVWSERHVHGGEMVKTRKC